MRRSESLRILLVEDDEDDFVLTRSMLQVPGDNWFQLEWEQSYLPALQAIREARHDLYLVDYRLGDRTGLDLVRDAWDREPRAPVIVLTHHAREPWVRQGGTTFTFVTDGIESALEQARVAAGDKDVRVAGGANTVQQFIRAGLIDELQIHLAPVLLGDGVRLFEHIDPKHIELESTQVIDSPKVTHLRYRVRNG